VVLGISQTPSIEPEQLENLIQDGFTLIDVREQDEWNAGHHQSAEHIPMGMITESMNRFKENEKYIFVCRSGARSGRVTNFIASKDIESYNLSGGMKELQNYTEKIFNSEGNPGQII
tara:strand:- start:933 stop:1283 length:351 start_codon:yes stop_codon:yes gene_type:complete